MRLKVHIRLKSTKHHREMAEQLRRRYNYHVRATTLRGRPMIHVWAWPNSRWNQ